MSAGARPFGTKDAFQEIAELKRRVGDLERSNRVQYSSMGSEVGQMRLSDLLNLYNYGAGFDASSTGTSSGSWTTDGGAGPSVSVYPGSTGRLLVIVGATVNVPTSTTFGGIGFRLTGGNVVSASDDNSAAIQSAASALTIAVSSARVLTGLTADVATTVEAMYRSDGTRTTNFTNRLILAIPL